MSNNELPEIFESFGDARRQGFLTVKNFKDAGKKVVGIFCTYTPVEIFMAAGAINVGLCSTSDETIPDAEKVLPRNLCPLIKSSYGFAITEKCPYMYFSDLVVGETTCDGKKKMYELLGEIKNVHVMQLPQRQDDQVSQNMWYQEVLALKERVEKDFNVTITQADIKEAIRKKNVERTLLKEFYELNKACPPPMTGLEQLKFLFGSQFKFDYDEKIAEIKGAIEKIRGAYDGGERKVSEKAKRILITGCPMGGVTEKVVQVLEEVGGVAVVLENCMGVKQIENLVDETAADPYQALADRYLQIGCSVMTPDNNRLKSLERLMEEFKVDGVVEMTLQACHTYNIETNEIKNFVESKGKPFVSVETDYSTSDLAQLKTRLAAFIEMF
ncbi:MAG: double-cubane-cluster-containing anaerobic reductase [Anaerovorax sp.]